MKRLLLPALTAALLVSFSPPLPAADAKAQLDELVEKVRAKLKGGKNSAADLADELQAFEKLLTEHQGEKTEEVARIRMMQAMLYAEVLEDDEKATELLKKVQTDFPDSAAAKGAVQALASMEKQSAARKIQQSLKPGVAFPEFEAKDLDGKPVSIAALKGKVVLIDFWATWCGPCVAELPNVLDAYSKHHAKGFEIVGVSLDQDAEKLKSFIKEKKMEWAQIFDGKGWQNELAQKYGINSIPATFLLDKEGKILAKDLRGEALEKAVADALK